jgi:hypothetical protein
MSGIDPEDFKRALAKLASARPPFIEGHPAGETTFPVIVTGVTERALVAAGQWPTPDTLTDQLIAVLAQAAEQEPEPERKARMQAAVGVVGGMLRSVIVGWVTGEIPHPH